MAGSSEQTQPESVSMSDLVSQAHTISPLLHLRHLLGSCTLTLLDYAALQFTLI